jgi:hypothetical protein
MERVEVLGYRQIMNLVENLDAFNFDLAQTLKHRIHGRVVGGGVIVSGGGIDRHRGQAVAKRVHPRTRFALLTAGASAFGAIALVCCDLPLRRHGSYFRDANAAASFSAMVFSAAKRSARRWLSRCSPDHPRTLDGDGAERMTETTGRRVLGLVEE